MRGPVVGQRPAVVQAVQVQGRRCSRVSAVWASEVSSVWWRTRWHRPGWQRRQSNRQVGKAHCRPLRSRPWPVCASGTPGHRARPVRDTVRELSPNGGSEGTRAVLGSCRHRRGGERDAELEEALSGLRIVKEDGGDRRTPHDCGLHRADSTTAAVRSSAAVRTSWQGRPSRSSGSARSGAGPSGQPHCARRVARIDVRIEGDLVVTEDGDENLSADEVAAWIARLAD